MSELLKIEKLCAGYGGPDVINDVTMRAEKGEFIALMGPNGSGKTTFLRALLGILKATSGSILMSGERLDKVNPKERAKRISFIPQVSSPVPGFSVEEIVAMGRNPHDTGPTKDRAAVESSLDRLNLTALKDADISRISGGEYQRVLIARALAQGTDIMLLDEPTAHLDIKYRVATMRILGSLRSEKLIIGVFHDIGLVKEFADRVVMMKNGRVIAYGNVEETLSDKVLNNVFDIIF